MGSVMLLLRLAVYILYGTYIQRTRALRLPPKYVLCRRAALPTIRLVLAAGYMYHVCRRS